MASIRYLDDGERFEFTPPDSESSFEAEEVPEEGSMIFEDPDTGEKFLVTLSNYEGDLDSDAIYRLVLCDCEVVEGEEEEIEEEEAEPVAEASDNGADGAD